MGTSAISARKQESSGTGQNTVNLRSPTLVAYRGDSSAADNYLADGAPDERAAEWRVGAPREATCLAPVIDARLLAHFHGAMPPALHFLEVHVTAGSPAALAGVAVTITPPKDGAEPEPDFVLTVADDFTRLPALEDAHVCRLLCVAGGAPAGGWPVLPGVVMVDVSKPDCVGFPPTMSLTPVYAPPRAGVKPLVLALVEILPELEADDDPGEDVERETPETDAAAALRLAPLEDPVPDLVRGMASAAQIDHVFAQQERSHIAWVLEKGQVESLLVGSGTPFLVPYCLTARIRGRQGGVPRFESPEVTITIPFAAGPESFTVPFDAAWKNGVTGYYELHFLFVFGADPPPPVAPPGADEAPPSLSSMDAVALGGVIVVDVTECRGTGFPPTVKVEMKPHAFVETVALFETAPGVDFSDEDERSGDD